jgi:hypothetical protein
MSGLRICVLTPQIVSTITAHLRVLTGYTVKRQKNEGILILQTTRFPVVLYKNSEIFEDVIR